MSKVKIYVSGRLRKILLKIKDESWLAGILSEGEIDENMLVDDPVNYIRLSKSDKNKISYLPPKKIESTIKYLSKNHSMYSFFKDTCDGYRPKDLKESDIPSRYFYNAKGRVKIKYGSFINKIFKNVPPKDIEKFSSLVKSITDQPDYEFKVVSGDDIRRYYHGSYHASNKGSLGVSCMRHDNCQNYFNMYVNSPEIKMLIMFNLYGGVLARAILWHLDEKNGIDGEFKFMDRIYSTKDDQFHLFYDWAKKNGYNYKEKQAWNTPYRFQFKNDTFHKKMKIKLKNPPHRWAKENGGPGLPYLDTFKWINLKDGTLYSYKPVNESMEVKRNIYTPVSTKGRVYGFNYIKEDEYKLEFWYEGELKFVDYMDKWVSERYLYYSDINETNILKEHAIIEEYTGEFIFSEEYDHLNDDDLIDEAIDLKKEEIRRKRERIKKEVKNTLGYFSEFVEKGNKLLDDGIKLNKKEDTDKVISKMADCANNGNRKELARLANLHASEMQDDHKKLSEFLKHSKKLMETCNDRRTNFRGSSNSLSWRS